MKPGFPENVSIVIRSRTQTIDAITHNAKYEWETIYEGNAWMYNISETIVENNVPIVVERTKLYVDSILATITEECELTVNDIGYEINSAEPQRGFVNGNHTELTITRRR